MNTNNKEHTMIEDQIMMTPYKRLSQVKIRTLITEWLRFITLDHFRSVITELDTESYRRVAQALESQALQYHSVYDSECES